MSSVSEASKGRIVEPSGAMFICGSSGCDTTYFYDRRPDRAIAGDLLEEAGAWWAAVRDLPPEYEIPPGVAAAIEAAYQASLGWVEWLDRTKPAKDGVKP